MKALNKSIRRAVYPIQKVDITLAQLKGAKVFSSIDAKAGYHQLKLDNESKKLTTFITPYGKITYTRLPFGVNFASNEFSREYTKALGDMQNVVILVDDVLIFCETIE